jgi:hypothetical protein
MACPKIRDTRLGRSAGGRNLVDEVRSYTLDHYLIIPVLRQALVHGIGPRIANTMEDIKGAIPQYVYTGLWEDVRLKEG